MSFSNASSSQSILSEKVSRALQVRTDTNAMKAALDALNHSDKTYDSRSVRVAIEQDALEQALLLQEQLKRIVTTVTELRQGIQDVTMLAQRVKQAVHTNVLTSETTHSTLLFDRQEPVVTSRDETGTATTSATTTAAATLTPTLSPLEQEQKLAAILSDAFAHKNACARRLDAVCEFLEKFDLSQEDSRLLDHYQFEDIQEMGGLITDTVINGTAFLKALERVKTIRTTLNQTFDSSEQRRADEMASSRGLGTSSALRMMDTLAHKQERAFERLYHWLQSFLQQASQGDAEDRLDEVLTHDFVRRSIYTLRHVPAFHSHTLELVANTRRTEETRRFLLALTSGYHGQAPIEMKSHDVVAYVNDMLAFCFRAFSIEADVAKGLLSYRPDEDLERDGQQQQQQPSDDDETKESNQDASSSDAVDLNDNDITSVETPITSATMLSISMSGLARPLKSRILQVISSLARRSTLHHHGNSTDHEKNDDDYDDEDGGLDDFDEEGMVIRTHLMHMYEIAGLLLFYRSAMNKGLLKLVVEHNKHGKNNGQNDDGEDEPNPLVDSLSECLLEVAKAYDATLRGYGAMMGHLSSMTGESEASLTHAMLSSLTEILLNSPGFVEGVDCPMDCQQVLSIEWASQVLIEASLSTCKALDDIVLLKQVVSNSKKVGLSRNKAEILDEAIDQKEKMLVDQIVEYKSAEVLDLCGLGPLVSSWRQWQEQGQGEDDQEGVVLMSNYPGLSPEETESAMKEFYASLYSPPIPSLETSLRDPLLRKQTRSKIARHVCELYRQLYEAILSSTQGGYEDVTFLGHSPSQVDTLFSV